MYLERRGNLTEPPVNEPKPKRRAALGGARVMPQLDDRSRVTAREKRSTTTVAPAPNRAHCHVAKVGWSTRTKGDGTPHVGSARLKRLELRGPEPDSNPYRYRRHPN